MTLLNRFLEQHEQTYVFDTSTLILLFEKCGLVDAFAKFTQKNKLLVPSRVMEEFFAGKNAEHHRLAFQNCFTALNVDLADELLPYFNFDSTSGEIWVISYALKNPSCICVIDERFASSVCLAFSVTTIGAIGIIEEMKKEGILSPCDLQGIRDKIRNSRFYLSKILCDELDRICLDHK